LFISPHLDDAVFSAGGIMARLQDEEHEVRLVTVFTRSVPDPTGFALACQLDKALPVDVDYMALRRAEDHAAAAALGLPAEAVHHLDLPEAPHRGYGSAAELFAGVRPDDAAFWWDVRDVLADQVANGDTLHLPLGLGNHVDHLHVIRAVEALADQRNVTLRRWHDTPYVRRYPADVWTRGETIDISHMLDRKLAACAAYTTQLGFQFGGESALRTALTDHAHAAAAGSGFAFAERLVT
jgi:LmbE family N-acetylglucosaminyl deacetylase